MAIVGNRNVAAPYRNDSTSFWAAMRAAEGAASAQGRNDLTNAEKDSMPGAANWLAATNDQSTMMNAMFMVRKAFEDEYGEDDEGKLEEWFEEYCEGFCPNVIVDNGVQMTDSFAQDAIMAIFPDYDTWIYECGRRVSDWVGFWLVAMRLAHEQLASADPEWRGMKTGSDGVE
jgi:hypothetical protein